MPKDPDCTVDVHEKLDRILVILEGTHDENGDHHPGLSHRVKSLEEFKRWFIGLGTAVVTLITGAWAVLGFGPHQPPGHP